MKAANGSRQSQFCDVIRRWKAGRYGWPARGRCLSVNLRPRRWSAPGAEKEEVHLRPIRLEAGSSRDNRLQRRS